MPVETTITFGRLESLLYRKENKRNYSYSFVGLALMVFLKEYPFYPRVECPCIYIKLSLNFFKNLKLIFHLKNKIFFLKFKKN